PTTSPLFPYTTLFRSQPQLPDQIVRVLDARIGAARTEGRHLVGRIADEQGAAMAELAHAPALERVDADPFKLEFVLFAQHGPDARNDPLGALFFLGVGVPAELEID